MTKPGPEVEALWSRFLDLLEMNKDRWGGSSVCFARGGIERNAYFLENLLGAKTNYWALPANQIRQYCLNHLSTLSYELALFTKDPTRGWSPFGVWIASTSSDSIIVCGDLDMGEHSGSPC